MKERKPQVQATRTHDSLWHLFLQEESRNATDSFTPDSSGPLWRSICLMRVHRGVAARLNAPLISWLSSLPRSHHVTSMKDLSGCVFFFFLYTSIVQISFSQYAANTSKRQRKKTNHVRKGSSNITSEAIISIPLEWWWSIRWTQSEWNVVKVEWSHI